MESRVHVVESILRTSLETMCSEYSRVLHRLFCLGLSAQSCTCWLLSAPSSRTSLACSTTLCGAHGFLLDTLPVGLDASSRGSSPCPAARQRTAAVPGPFADTLELYALLLVPVDVLLVGLVPRVVFVSLECHEAFDVQHSSHASLTQTTAPGRCWIDIELVGQLLLFAI